MGSDSALDLLATQDGRAILSYLAEREVNPDDSLRVGAQLRKRYPNELVAAALAQYELRRKAAEKFTRADQMFFTRDGLEQASSELAARHRAARFAAAGDGKLADLCCGIGGDLVALAETRHVVGVDLNDLHLRMAVLNAATYGVDDTVAAVVADVRDTDLTSVSAVFIDPARRKRGQRMRLGESEPPLSWCIALAGHVAEVAIKAAPGIDRAAVPTSWETEFVSIGRDLKEAVLWSPALASAPSRATILPEGHTIETGPVAEPVDVREPGRYLIDPNPAVTRAGVVEDLARSIDAWKIDSKIAFLSTDEAVETPFGRVLEVVESLPWNEKRVRVVLRQIDVGSVDIRRRGLAGDVDQIRRRLKLGGSRRVTLVMTRVADRPWCLICRETPNGRI